MGCFQSLFNKLRDAIYGFGHINCLGAGEEYILVVFIVGRKIHNVA